MVLMHLIHQYYRILFQITFYWTDPRKKKNISSVVLVCVLCICFIWIPRAWREDRDSRKKTIPTQKSTEDQQVFELQPSCFCRTTLSEAASRWRAPASSSVHSPIWFPAIWVVPAKITQFVGRKTMAGVELMMGKGWKRKKKETFNVNKPKRLDMCWGSSPDDLAMSRLLTKSS